MSKEIAQAVGTKRIGLLFALLAAFAVFAMVAGQWNSASADVVDTDYEITWDDPNGNGIVGPGDIITYEISFTLTQPTTGALEIAGVLDPNLEIDEFGPNTGPTPECTGVGTNAFSCVYAPNLDVDATGTLVITAKVLGTVEDGGDLQEPAVTADDASNQEPEEIGIDEDAPPLATANAILNIEKSAAPSVVDPGQNVTYTIVISNGGSLAADVNLTDVLPAEISAIQSITTEGASASCQPSGPFPVDVDEVTCEFEVSAMNGEVVVTIVATVDPGLAERTSSTPLTITNTASYTATVNDEPIEGGEDTASVTVNLPEPPDVLPDPAYTTLVAWAGQRIVLEADFGDFIVSLLIAEIEEDIAEVEEQLAEDPENEELQEQLEDLLEDLEFAQSEQCGEVLAWWSEEQSDNGDLFFTARYVRHAGSHGTFVDHYISLELGNSVAYTWVNDDCRAFVVYQSEQQGEVHVDATLNVGPVDLPSSKVSFLIYYLQIEDVELGIVTGQENAAHNARGALWVPGNPWDASTDVTEDTRNVSADVLLRGRVRGWFLNDNPSGRPQQGNKPANRWILPDDWNTLAGGEHAAEFRPTFDRMFGPNEGQAIPTPDTYPAPNGVVNHWDAPMPPAQITVSLTGTGFLRQVLKENVYYDANGYTNPFYQANIPSHWFLNPTTSGGGYLWDSHDYWAIDSGLPTGPYPFWAALTVADWAAGDQPWADADEKAELEAELDELRGLHGDDNIGRRIQVYSDNHGEFMVIANGDFLFSIANCGPNPLSGGKLCEPGDVVGAATIHADADYPDRRQALPPISSNNVEITWEWGGYKDVTVEPDPLGNDQFVYVVYHAIDRDGFCEVPSGAVSRGSVLGQDIHFLLDSGEGVIIDTSAGTGPILFPDRIEAADVPTHAVHIEDVGTGTNFPFSPLAPEGTEFECQAWIKVSNSLLGITDALVIAHGSQPEGDANGDVMFDAIVDFAGEETIQLFYRWSLVTWIGADNIPVADALAGTGANDAGNDITDQVTAVYGWNAEAQQWLGYFPAGVGVPGANDLTALRTGNAYWIAIVAPGPVNWTIATAVN